MKRAKAQIGLILSGLCLGAVGARAASAPESIGARLHEAKALQAARRQALQPLERDLVFLADFEHDSLVFLGDSNLLPVALPFQKSHYRQGRFGRGYYFEKPRHNLLPPEIADPETDLAVFSPVKKATLKLVSADTRFGNKVLSVELPGPGSGFETAPVRVRHQRLSWHESSWTLLASGYVKGPKDTEIRIEVFFVPDKPPEPDMPKKPDEEQGDDSDDDLEEMLDEGDDAEDTKEPIDVPVPPPPKEITSTPQEIVLTGEWQRVACAAWATVNKKSPKPREAAFRLTLAGPGPAMLLADGLQFEQCKYYPHGHDMPTTWTHGKETLGRTSVTIAREFRNLFPVKEGTIAFWMKTPRESNLRNVGGQAWVSFCEGWAPGWRMTNYRFSAGGEGFIYFNRTNVSDGDWHHVAMAWGGADAYIYKDGSPHSVFKHKRSLPKPSERSVLCVGGGIPAGQGANAVMDEVAILKRKLSDQEIRELARSKQPLRTGAGAGFNRSVRSVFYRDEAEAHLQVPMIDLVGTSRRLVVDCSIGEVVFAKAEAELQDGHGGASVPFSPSQLKCGEYLCRVGSLEAEAYLEFPIHIVPALRRDHFMFSSWGAGGETTKWRELSRTLGLNTIDTYATNLEDLGRDGFLYCWHYNFGNSIWSPENRRSVRESTRKAAEQRAIHPNWRYTLLNSERGAPLPGEKDRAAWFDGWARQELGFDVPEKGWKFGTSHNRTMLWFPEGQKPGEDGIYADSKEFKFLYWWYNRGHGLWRINAEAADVIKSLRPDIKCWTDPARHPGQFTGLDAGSAWSYAIWPSRIIGRFLYAHATARGDGREFYATLGVNYVAKWLEKIPIPEGEKTVTRVLCPTADDLIQQAWIAVAGLPTDGITYWSLSSFMDKGKYYLEPDSASRLGAVIKRDLLPIGTALKHVPYAPKPVALLVPESTAWPISGEGGWNWGPSHFINHWQGWLASASIPYDVLRHRDATAETLKRYQVIIFPMGRFVAKEVFDALTEAGQAGSRIIVDRYCRQDYPNMERWGQGYYYVMKDRKDYGKGTVRRLEALYKELQPKLNAYAEGEKGDLFTFVREHDGVKYVVLINDCRKAGPYTEWTKKESFKPYGVPQKATVYLRAPPDSVVYEFTESRLVPTKKEGAHLVVEVALPAHGGRLLCIYPAEFGKIDIRAAAAYPAGRSGSITLVLSDAKGQPVRGRQLAEVTILDPEGRTHDESGIYRMEAGKTTAPFRPAINEPAGKWQIRVRERTSGLTSGAVLEVTPPSRP